MESASERRRYEMGASVAVSRGVRSITQICDSLGLTFRAVHYYEQIGLVESVRGTGNVRIFRREACRRLELVARLRAAGVGLAPIRAILDLPPEAAAERDRAIARVLRRELEDLDARRERVLAALAQVGDGKATSRPAGEAGLRRATR